ncbi:hypothetical protein PMAYCL1PPCAC_16446, partial [Pristionchus mayeri]
SDLDHCRSLNLRASTAKSRKTTPPMIVTVLTVIPSATSRPPSTAMPVDSAYAITPPSSTP